MDTVQITTQYPPSTGALPGSAAIMMIIIRTQERGEGNAKWMDSVFLSHYTAMDAIEPPSTSDIIAIRFTLEFATKILGKKMSDLKHCKLMKIARLMTEPVRFSHTQHTNFAPEISTLFWPKLSKYREHLHLLRKPAFSSWGFFY